MNDVVEVTTDSERNLRTVGHISYALHAIVAVGAVVPGFQPGVLLLVAAFILDLVKRGDAAGTWQESHFRWRIHSVLWAAGLYLLTSPLFLLLFLLSVRLLPIVSIVEMRHLAHDRGPRT